MPAPARAKTAHWAPRAPKTRPFRYGVRSDPPSDPPLPRGTIIADRYRLDGLIGEGGMGQVYAAEHVSLGHRVALKLLRRDRSQSERAARLRQEARAASRIGHRAIVDVVDFDTTADGLVYLAMELLRGESFEDWLERPGSMLDGVRWLAEAARGLHAAHDAGIVHRDIKPDNVYLHHGTDGSVQPKLLDFGLAKATATDLTQVETQAGTLLGTPYYLAPERALGRPLDPRTDLYSLGVVLYETLTGNVPFVDDSFMGILARHIKSKPLDPRQAAPDRALPDDLCMVTMALLSKDPADRPASGDAVAELLERVAVEHATGLAAVVSGPRDVSGPGDETTNLDVIAERPTSAPDDSAPTSASTSGGTVLAGGARAGLGRANTALALGGGLPDAFSDTVAPTDDGPVTTSTGTVVAGASTAAALVAGAVQSSSGASDGDSSPSRSGGATTRGLGSGGIAAGGGTVLSGSSGGLSFDALGLELDRTAPRNRARPWLIAAGAVAAIALGGVIALVFRPDPTAAPPAPTAPQPTATPSVGAPAPTQPAAKAAAKMAGTPAPAPQPGADPDGDVSPSQPSQAKPAAAADPPASDSDKSTGTTKRRGGSTKPRQGSRRKVSDVESPSSDKASGKLPKSTVPSFKPEYDE